MSEFMRVQVPRNCLLHYGLRVSRPVFLLVAALFALLGLAAATAETPTATKKKATSTRKKRSPRKSVTPSSAKPAVKGSKSPVASGKKSSSRKKTRASTSKKQTTKARRSYRSAQQQPTPERYKEIQQALADKGYYHGPVNGVWGPESAGALKQFQRDQNIDDDGKIDSLSLIALGLGPKRTADAQTRPQP